MRFSPYILSGEEFPVQRKSRPGALWQTIVGLVREEPHRPIRVLVLLLAILFFNLFDLVLTLQAGRLGGFDELNPLARPFVDSEPSLIAFKFSLILPAMLVFLFFRRRLLTEIGCWLLLAAHLVLTGMWVSYYAML